MNGFDWNLVRAFLGVLERGSLQAAARAIGSSQPTLSRHVAELEGRLGVPLFERGGRGLVPTATALALADSARAMDDAAARFVRTALDAGRDVAGTVRLSASQPVACFLLPPLLARMRDALPDVQVELVATNDLSNLLRREADIALRMVDPRQPGVIARRIGEVTIGAWAHRDYLRRRGTPREPADLAGHDLIAGDRDDAVRRGMAAAGLEADPARLVLRTDDLVAAWQALRAGVGVGFVADFLARTDPALVPLLPALRIPPLPLWLAVHRELRHNARIRAVRDFLAREVPAALQPRVSVRRD